MMSAAGTATLLPSATTVDGGAARRIRAYESQARPVIGAALLAWITIIYLMDWAFAFRSDDSSVRFWPHLIRGAFIAITLAFLITRLQRTLTLRIARYQVIWLLVIYSSYFYRGRFESRVTYYMAYYSFWILVMWVVYCFVSAGKLTLRQVSRAGAFLCMLTLIRMALYVFGSIWLGGTTRDISPEAQLVNSSYPLLWFTLMQLLAPSAISTTPLTVVSMAVVVLTVKRGSLIALAFGALTYAMTYLYLHRTRGAWSRTALVTSISLVFTGLAAWMSASELLRRWNGLFEPTDAGSGRAVFWPLILNHWLSATHITQLSASDHIPLMTLHVWRGMLLYRHTMIGSMYYTSSGLSVWLRFSGCASLLSAAPSQ